MLYPGAFRTKAISYVRHSYVLRNNKMSSSAIATSSVDEPSTSSSESTKTNDPLPADRKSERIQRLRELQLRRNEARKLNHKEVVEEDRRLKLPENHEAKRKRAEWILQDDEQRKDAEARGLDYNRLKLLDVTAEEADRLEKKKKKKTPNQGFAGYEEASFRQYQRNTKQMKVDMEDYERKKDKMGDDMYPGKDTIMQGNYKDSEEGLNRMVTDLEKQIDKRSKYSRRRAFNEEDDIDYINERNMRFNKKAERFYGKYTKEIKQNLERGTAV